MGSLAFCKTGMLVPKLRFITFGILTTKRDFNIIVCKLHHKIIKQRKKFQVSYSNFAFNDYNFASSFNKLDMNSYFNKYSIMYHIFISLFILLDIEFYKEKSKN